MSIKTGRGSLIDGAGILTLLLAGWGLFGWLLRDSLFIYGDNPGQFARLWFGTKYGIQGWVPDWYAGYPELQFYPPGFVLLGQWVAALHPGALESDYNALLFVAALLPALGCYGFCRYALRQTSVPGGAAAGMVAGGLALLFPVQWGGIHAITIGLTAERLAFGVVPFVLWAGWAFIERPRVWKGAVLALLMALLALLHPFHLPAPVLALALYAAARRERWRVWLGLGATLVITLGLIAWWLIPLLIYRTFAAPLVRATVQETLNWLIADPVPLLALGALVAAGWAWRRGPARATVAALAGLAVLLPIGIWLDHAVLIQQLHIYLFDPIRFAAEFYLALILLTALAVALPFTAPRPLWRTASIGILSLVIAGAAGWNAFSQIWEPAAQRDTYFLATLQSYPALAGWWEELAQGEGRVLYTSSYLRLPQADGRVLPTALKTLTPYFSGREQVGGTFSHWSPVARLLWQGDASVAVLPERVERDDDQTFLGMRWDTMDEERFWSVARSLNVGTIVTSVEDVNARTFLDGSAYWQSYWNNGYFYLYRPTQPVPGWASVAEGMTTVNRLSPTEWQIDVVAPPNSPVALALAYFPTWRATAAEEVLPLSAIPEGLMRIERGNAGTITLEWGKLDDFHWISGLTVAGVLFATVWEAIRARRAYP